MSSQIQSSTLPPAIPTYILRGHIAQIHSLQFLRQNLRLLSGDADGWVVLWNLIIKRAVAVWRAHEDSVLGAASWGCNKIITHGRDSKLIVWQLDSHDEARFSKTLPIDDNSTDRPKPWIVHVLTVNTLNFCSFGMCVDPKDQVSENDQNNEQNQNTRVLVATPGIDDGHIAITSLPGETRFASIPPPRGVKTGMLMSVALVRQASIHNGSANSTNTLHVLAGYESGHVALWMQNASQKWEAKYTSQAHTQPVLSVAAAPRSSQTWFSSSADATIARHPLFSPWHDPDSQPSKIQTKHAGQQGLSVRSDEKIFATAGWDARVRVYSTKTMAELAVLKWHKEGCYATAFAEIWDSTPGADEGDEKKQLTIAAQRLAKTQSQHLLAAGSKDGKISLWDIY